MKLFVFHAFTNHGEFLRGIIHNSIEEAFEFKSNSGEKSLKELGWKIKDLIFSIDVNGTIGIAFDGGGDLG